MPKRVFLFLLVLWSVFMGPLAVAADPRTLSLSISVTNPSPDQTREMDFKTELPGELKRDDIISSDGLNVVYDSGTQVFAVEGKANLRPGETIYYRIHVRDVWLIPENEFDELELNARNLRSEHSRDSVLQLLNKIEARQEQNSDNVVEHIAIYRENRKELESIRKELLTEHAVMTRHAVKHPWFLILIAGLAVLGGTLGIFLFGRNRMLPGRSSSHFLKLSEDIKVHCILLPQGNVAPSPHRSSPHERGISLVLDERYPDHAAIEMKLGLPGSQQEFLFTGFVSKQSPVTVEGKARFETLVSLVEAGGNSYETLRQYIQTRPKD